MSTSRSSMEIANTILDQLGGNRFQVMTGAASFTATGQGLSMLLPSSLTKNRIRGIRIELAGDDTYTISAYSIRGVDRRLADERTGVHCENLQSVFEDVTGLLCSLGTMGKPSRRTTAAANPGMDPS